MRPSQYCSNYNMVVANSNASAPLASAHLLEKSDFKVALHYLISIVSYLSIIYIVELKKCE